MTFWMVLFKGSWLGSIMVISMIALSSKATGGAMSFATAFLTISAVELVKASTAETRTSMEVLGVLLPMTFMMRTLKMLVAILVATKSSSWTFVCVDTTP